MSVVNLSFYTVDINKVTNPDDTLGAPLFVNGTSYFPTTSMENSDKSLHIRCYQWQFHSPSSSLDQKPTKTVLFEAGTPFFSTIWANTLIDIQSKVQAGPIIFNDTSNCTSIYSNSNTSYSNKMDDRNQYKIKQYCVYDRFGYGWSDFTKDPLLGLDMAKNLKSSLEQIGVQSNIIYVGWSYGGILGQLFTHQYPDSVDGLVLVDSMDIQDLNDSFLKSLIRTGINSFRALKYLLPTGLLRIPVNFPLSSGYLDGDTDIPYSIRRSSNIIYQTYGSVRTSMDELSILFDSITQLKSVVDNSTRYLGSKPLVVLTAGNNGGEDWIDRQKQMTKAPKTDPTIIPAKTSVFIPPFPHFDSSLSFASLVSTNLKRLK
eukprot:gene3822-4755_t